MASKTTKWLTSTALGFTALLQLQCADDIKGEPGQDAPATAVIALKRPGFRSSSLDTSKVVVPATTNRPARVLIENSVYTNTTDVSCDVTVTGRGGIDTGTASAQTVYYLYAIPAESGTTFDTVASLSPPSTGPLEFSAWSYLGAFDFG